MADLLFQKMMEDAKRGEYGLLEKLLNKTHPTILEKIAPDNLKEKLQEKYIGKPIFVLKIVNLDGTIEYQSDVDYITVWTSFNDQTSKEVSEAYFYESIIIGGTIDNWIFDKDNLIEIQMQIVDTKTSDAFFFKTKVTLEVTGRAKGGTEEDYIRKQMISAVTPMFVFSRILESSTEIQEISIEM